MTPGSGDFGADLLCRIGDEFIVIQCKCYDDASSIGVAAVQEACTAARHFNASLGLVVYEGRPSKSAKSLAHSVGVRLFHADELIEGWEYDRTAEGTSLRITQQEQREAAQRVAAAREIATRAAEYRLDREAYLVGLKEWEVRQSSWEKKSKSWSGGWAGGAGMSAGFGALVLFSGGPSGDTMLGLGLLAIGVIIFFTKFPGSAPTKLTPPVPIEGADLQHIPPSQIGARTTRPVGRRVIIRCSRCNVQLRVPPSKRLRIGCPRCGLSEVRQTPPGAMFEH